MAFLLQNLAFEFYEMDPWLKGLWYAQSKISCTCDWRFDFDHCLFISEQHGSFVDDPEGCGLVDPALQDEVLFQHIRTGLVGARVKHFAYCQLA